MFRNIIRHMCEYNFGLGICKSDTMLGIIQIVHFYFCQYTTQNIDSNLVCDHNSI